MPKQFPVKFSLEINIPGYRKKIIVGINQSGFTDPRKLFITSYTKNGERKTKIEDFSTATELTKVFGLRLKEFCNRAFR